MALKCPHCGKPIPDSVVTALRVTPAMEAKVTHYVWSVQELLSFGSEQARAA